MAYTSVYLFNKKFNNKNFLETKGNIPKIKQDVLNGYDTIQNRG